MPISELELVSLPPSDTRPPAAPRRPVVVSVRGLTQGYGNQPVLDGVSFELEQGRVYSIIGPSGCGKTTLLKCMLGLKPADAGEVSLLGGNIEAARTRIGVLFQSAALISSMSVFDNAALPLRQHRKLPEAETRERVMRNLKLVGMADAATRMPGELSGGMKKRAALARAIALEPELLFLDEPTSGADPIMAAILDDLVLDLTRRIGATAVVVTHDMRSAFRLSHEILMLWGGRIHKQGAPSEFIEADDAAINQFVQGRKDGPVTTTG
jgi:phospholipid/cholesterol/gamma-HCH transport system ATP-binding protein